jgi:hypothetical protein
MLYTSIDMSSRSPRIEDTRSYGLTIYWGWWLGLPKDGASFTNPDYCFSLSSSSFYSS